jgi:hypothetical protein
MGLAYIFRNRLVTYITPPCFSRQLQASALCEPTSWLPPQQKPPQAFNRTRIASDQIDTNLVASFLSTSLVLYFFSDCLFWVSAANMAPAVLSTLQLNHPIPLSEVKLGRLITDPLYPDDNFLQPEASEAREQDDESARNASPLCNSPAMKTSIQPFHSFNETLERARGTKLELSLLNLLSGSTNRSGRSSRTIESPLCLIHQVRNPEAYFATVCKDRTAREWMEEQRQRPKTSVYLICGFKTLTDVTLEQDEARTTEFAPSASVSVATIAGAVAGVPTVLPDGVGDVGASMNITRESSESLGYSAPGERVYALQCRKIHFKRFSTKVDGSRLEKKDQNCWISYIDGRSGDVEDEDGVEAELAGAFSLEDTDNEYETFGRMEIGGEEILFQYE